MAFMGRDRIPSNKGNDMKNIQDKIEKHRGYRNTRYRYEMGLYYRISLDNTYVIMQMIVTFIILIVGLITFLATYKSIIIDPIESTKQILINTYLIIIGVLLTITLIINFFSKEEKKLIKRLIIISITSIIIMLAFLGIKLQLDTTYTKSEFENLYTEQNEAEVLDNKLKIDMELTGVSIKTEKEYYIDECLKLYGIFSTKFYATIGIHFLLNILIIYQMFRIGKKQGKKDKLNKDDLILYDEEENIKI